MEAKRHTHIVRQFRREAGVVRSTGEAFQRIILPDVGQREFLGFAVVHRASIRRDMAGRYVHWQLGIIWLARTLMGLGWIFRISRISEFIRRGEEYRRVVLFQDFLKYCECSGI
jgi:hypothetical protein